MVNDSGSSKTLTQRSCLKYDGVIAGNGPLAGCSGTSKLSSLFPESCTLSTQTAVSETTSETDTATGSDESYTITIEPVDEVMFDSPSERQTTSLSASTDMTLTLGGR